MIKNETFVKSSYSEFGKEKMRRGFSLNPIFQGRTPKEIKLALSLFKHDEKKQTC